MKFFMKVLYVVAFLGIAFIFVDSGKSARDDKYVKDVILKNKGDDTLENNQNPEFVANLFALNGLIYKTDIVMNINYSNKIEINETLVDVSVNIDIYQVLGFYTNPYVKSYFNAVINEFSIDGDTSAIPIITGNYELPVYYDNKTSSYEVKSKTFPIFGLSDIVNGTEKNSLNSAIVKYDKTELFEIVLEKSVSEELESKFYLKDSPTYPENLEQMYDDLFSILDSKSGGFVIPDEDKILKLNDLGYNYQIFKGQEAYNYLIYIYVGLYILILSFTTFFVYLKPYYKKKKLNRK